MMEMLIIGALNIVCFYVGAKIGQKTVKGEDIKLPDVTLTNPLETYRKKKATEAEQNRIETIMQNIEAYNGTSAGQKDVD